MDKKKEFILCEIMRVDIDKWFEGLEQHQDPGNEYIIEWIKDNAAQYRDDWENSLCCTCTNWEDCGWRALFECDYYQEEAPKEN